MPLNLCILSKMPKISAVIITKNEATNIAQCLQSLLTVVDEILLIDAFSIDDTVKIAQELGAKVIQVKWEGYSQNKNYGNQLAKHDWILSVDADEVLSPKLINSIRALKLNESQVYSINRLNNYCGQWIKHCGWHPDWNNRLFHRKKTEWKGDFVHEKLNFPSSTKIVRLEGLLYHYSYQNSADHWQRIERYAQLSAQQLFQNGKKATFIKLCLAPIARFIRTYFLKMGFLDGKVGWTISVRTGYLVRKKYQLLRILERQVINQPK